MSNKKNEKLASATNNSYRIDVREYLKDVSGGENELRISRLNTILDGLRPNEVEKFRVEECVDEKSGRRYGEAKIRKGRAEKIGSGGRNKGSRYAYQLWAVWN
jgi:hypothetical protein